MAIINGLGPRTLRVEQHGQVFRILDQNNQVYGEIKDRDLAESIVQARNDTSNKREYRYVQISRPVIAIYGIESVNQAEATMRAQFMHEQLRQRNKIQWYFPDKVEEDYKFVQENEYQQYRRWRDGWKP